MIIASNLRRSSVTAASIVSRVAVNAGRSAVHTRKLSQGSFITPKSEYSGKSEVTIPHPELASKAAASYAGAGVISPKSEYSGRKEVSIEHKITVQKEAPSSVQHDVPPGDQDAPWTPKSEIGKTPMV
jgi:hypothetical protein